MTCFLYCLHFVVGLELYVLLSHCPLLVIKHSTCIDLCHMLPNVVLSHMCLQDRNKLLSRDGYGLFLYLHLLELLSRDEGPKNQTSTVAYFL